MPRKLRLLKVGPDGYTVGTGVTQPQNNVVVPHEVAVAILTGLAEDQKLIKDATPHAPADDPIPALALKDAANAARRALAAVAWRLGYCSWNREWRATTYTPSVFQTQSE